MPLANRSIQPEWLGRRKLTDDEKHEDIVHVAVCHNAVVGVLVQLASLVRHADDLFCDLAEECQAIFEKTESITNKVQRIEHIVLQMDSTEVKIPVGTLEEFSRTKEHHVAKHGFECNLFTPTNRPYCIKAQHAMCEVTPIHALRGVDLYRKDGLSTSILFKLWPIALKETVVKSEDMNTPNGTFHPHMYKKRYKELKIRERPKTIDHIDEFFFHDEDATSDLQSNKTGGLSKSQPSMLVAVDTTGAGFERMASFRRSMTNDDLVGRVDRKKRRRTVGGISQNIIQEIDQFERGRRILREGPRKYSLDNLDDIDARDEIMQQFLKEIDNQRAERAEQEYAEKDSKKLLKLIPCRRAKSLPRCVKLLSETFSKKESTRTPLYVKRSKQKVPVDEMMRLTKEDTCNSTTVHHFGGSNGSLISSGTGRLSRSSTRSSIIGNKIKSLMAGSGRNSIKRRPKSLDFDSVGVIDEDDKKKKKNKQGSERSVSMSRIGAETPTPEVVTRAASSESTIGPGSYYYFDSNTIPRAQQCKYDFPWDSLPKDWTTAVRLREITKRRKEERQSSSGNWSASGYSSSNRQSMDSDAKPGMPAYLASQHSLGKDSGRDSPVEEKDGLDTGYMGDAASMESISDTKSMSNTDSDDWIKTLAERAASRGDVTSTSADALASLSRLTKENIRNLDILVPGRSPRHRMARMELDEDGESSVYSLDQDGFYTSFHNDSGLRRSSNNLLEEDEDLMMPRIRECKSLQSMSSHTTSDSAMFRTCVSAGKLTLTSSSSNNSSSQNTTLIQDSSQPGDSEDTLDMDSCGIEYGDTGTIKPAKKSKAKKKSLPPPPPPRISSHLRGSVLSDASSKDEMEMIDVDNLSPSPSESSDQETIYARLKMKTRISAQAIPSLCSNVMSDEEDTVSRDTMSSSRERLNAEAVEIETILKGGKLPGTLPRVKHNLSLKEDLEEFEYPAHSWPRLKKQHGILKSPEKEKGKWTSPQKTLNFAPVVNLFDPHTPGGAGKQLPLSRLSSSDESPCSPPTSCISTFDSPAFAKKGMTVGVVSIPMDRNGMLVEQTLRESSKEWEQPLPSSTPIAKPSMNGVNTFYSNDQSSSSFDTLSQDSFHGLDPKPLGNEYDKHNDIQGSTSTIALSDIDNGSLTHVSLTDSTPSGSTLSLNWDTDYTPNITPMPTPSRTHKSFNDKKDLSSLNNLSSPPSIGDLTLKRDTNVCNPHVVEDIGLSETSVLPPPPSPPPSSTSPSPASPPLPPPPLPPPRCPLANSSSHSSHIYSSHTNYSSTKLSSKEDQSIITPIISDIASSSLVPSDDKINNNNKIYNNNNNSVVSAKMKRHQYSYSSESSCSDNNRQLHVENINHNNTSCHFVFPESNSNNSCMPKSNSWSADENANIGHSKRSTHQANSFQYNPSWSGGTNKYQPKTSHSHRSQTVQQQQQQQPINGSERQRSAPVTIDALKMNQSSNFVGSDASHRRRNSSNLTSPMDSVFGSPLPFPNSSSGMGEHSYHSTSNRSSMSSLTSSDQNYDNQSSISSKVPQIKQPLLGKESSTNYPSISPYYKQSSSTNKSESVARPISVSRSSDSLNSQHSTSSSKNLISQPSNPDYVRPILLRGSSNESLKSNSSAGRSDSYRVAQMSEYNETASLIPSNNNRQPHSTQTKQEEKKKSSKYNTRSQSTSSANPLPTAASSTSQKRNGPSLTKSLSTPAPNSSQQSPLPTSCYMPSSAYEVDAFCRADSYRCAMQNSDNQTQQKNWMARNSSYRLANADEDVVFNSRMESYSLWTGTTGGTRDVRRMGITDVDMLKTFDGHQDSGTKQGQKNGSETVHVRKKLSVKENGPNTGIASQNVQLRQTVRSNPKDKSKQKTQSSSYIRFDPIFESREDIRASKESLRPPSITSIRTLTNTEANDSSTADTAHRVNYRGASANRRRSGSQGRRSSDEKPGFLGTLKTTIKSIGGGKGES